MKHSTRGREPLFSARCCSTHGREMREGSMGREPPFSWQVPSAVWDANGSSWASRGATHLKLGTDMVS